jgi:curved DNA-binding protein CbpA
VTAHLNESDVIHACRTLFGSDTDISRGFLLYMQPSGAKSAYRRKAKETHPDFFHNEDNRIQQQQTALFRDILEAYDVLNEFFKEREEGLWTASVDSAIRTYRTETHHARSSAAQSTQTRNDNGYYRGPVPFRVLEIGRYLYYSGHISYSALIEALIWQRKQRPIIGNVALRWGWLVKTSIERITAARDVPGRFGEKAVRLGLLSGFQVNTLLYYQRTQQERLGKYFVIKKLLTAEQLELLARKLNEHNALVLASKKDTRQRCNIFV